MKTLTGASLSIGQTQTTQVAFWFTTARPKDCVYIFKTLQRAAGGGRGKNHVECCNWYCVPMSYAIFSKRLSQKSDTTTQITDDAQVPFGIRSLIHTRPKRVNQKGYHLHQQHEPYSFSTQVFRVNRTHWNRKGNARNTQDKKASRIPNGPWWKSDENRFWKYVTETVLTKNCLCAHNYVNYASVHGPVVIFSLICYSSFVRP